MPNTESWIGQGIDCPARMPKQPDSLKRNRKMGASTESERFSPESAIEKTRSAGGHLGNRWKPGGGRALEFSRGDLRDAARNVLHGLPR